MCEDPVNNFPFGRYFSREKNKKYIIGKVETKQQHFAELREQGGQFKQKRSRRQLFLASVHVSTLATFLRTNAFQRQTQPLSQNSSFTLALNKPTHAILYNFTMNEALTLAMNVSTRSSLRLAH